MSIILLLARRGLEAVKEQCQWKAAEAPGWGTWRPKYNGKVVPAWSSARRLYVVS